MIDLLFGAKVPLIAIILALLWWIEGSAPLFLERRARPVRLGRHLFLAVFNGILVVPFLSVAAWLASNAAVQEHGLLARLALPSLVETLLVLALIDLWMYLWHRANHSIPLLWRFHSVHHSDPELDSTSAFRFHTGEIVLSALFRLFLVPVLSIELWHLALYDLLMLPVIMLHHSNVDMPARLDRTLRAVIVTPWMHWVHHSSYQPETDSNFSTIFSFWDRLFSTFRLVEEPRSIRFGLEQFRDMRWQGLRGLFLIPFVSAPDPGEETDGSQKRGGKPSATASRDWDGTEKKRSAMSVTQLQFGSRPPVQSLRNGRDHG